MSYLSFLFVIFAGALLGGWINSSRVASALLRQELVPRPPEETWGNRDAVTLLLLGCDVDLSPGGAKVLKEQARADMLLVARLDFANHRISGVSIPRDTECRLPGGKRRKINAYHAIAKPGQGGELTKQAVEHILPGVHVDRVVVLDYEAFQRMVDLVGGVQLDIKKPMTYNDNAGNLHINLKPGRQVLNGYEAMGFVRYRHDDSDFMRQDRQKQFLVSFKSAVMGQPAKLTAVAEEALNVFGNALSPDEIAGLAYFARRVPESSIKMGQIPVRGNGNTYLRVDERKLSRVLGEYNLVDRKTTQVSLR